MRQYIDKKYKPIKGGTGGTKGKKMVAKKKPPTDIRIPKPPKTVKKRAR